MNDTISTDEIDKSILEFDPFEGDFGMPGDTVFSNKMVIARKPRPCSHCGTAIEKGERIRSQTSKFDGQLITHGWCSKCCSAMASYWDELKNDDLDMPTYERRSKPMRGAINDTITLPRAVIEQAIDTIGYYASVASEDDQDTPAKQMQTALRAALAQQAEPPIKFRHGCQWCGKQNCTTHTQVAQQAEQGWVRVPVEPTQEMINAGRTTPMPSDSEFDEDEDYRAWQAWMAAAPKGTK